MNKSHGGGLLFMFGWYITNILKKQNKKVPVKSPASCQLKRNPHTNIKISANKRKIQ